MKCLLVIAILVIQNAAAQSSADAGAIEKIIQATLAKVQSSTDAAINKIQESHQSILNEVNELIKGVDLTEEQNDELIEIKAHLRSGLSDILEELRQQGYSAQKEIGQVIAKCFEDHPFTALWCATKDAAKVYAAHAIKTPKSFLDATSELREQAIKDINALIAKAKENPDA